MRAKDFVPAVVAWLEKHGAVKGGANLGSYEFRLNTKAGILFVSPDGTLIITKSRGRC